MLGDKLLFLGPHGLSKNLLCSEEGFLVFPSLNRPCWFPRSASDPFPRFRCNVDQITVPERLFTSKMFWLPRSLLTLSLPLRKSKPGCALPTWIIRLSPPSRFWPRSLNPTNAGSSNAPFFFDLSCCERDQIFPHFLPLIQKPSEPSDVSMDKALLLIAKGDLSRTSPIQLDFSLLQPLAELLKYSPGFQKLRYVPVWTARRALLSPPRCLWRFPCRAPLFCKT